VVDGASKSVIATLPVTIEPLGVAVSPDGTKAYVASTGGGGDNIGRLTIIDATLNTIIGGVPLSNAPTAAALSPNGSHILVTTLNSGVYVINAGTLQIEGTIASGGGGSDSIALAPRSPFGYTVNAPGQGQIAVLQIAAKTLFDSFSVDEFNTGANVQAVAVSPSGRNAYFTDSTQAQVIVFDTVHRNITRRIALPGANPIGLSLTPDGKKAYVAGNGNGSVIVVDLTSNTVVKTIPVLGAPYSKGQFIATQLPD
jgi:YVTN family beta-propeller protein